MFQKKCPHTAELQTVSKRVSQPVSQPGYMGHVLTLMSLSKSRVLLTISSVLAFKMSAPRTSSSGVVSQRDLSSRVAMTYIYVCELFASVVVVAVDMVPVVDGCRCCLYA